MDSKRGQTQNNKMECNIIIESECFPVNKDVLRKSSKYFNAMFEGNNFQESQMSDVTIQNIDPDAFDQFLNFIYTGETSCDNIHGLTEMYHCGHIIDSPLFLNHVEEIICNELDPYNCSVIISMAELYSSKKMINSALPVLKKYISIASKTAEFQWLTTEVIIEVIEKNSFSEEIDLLEAVLRWASADFNDRKSDAENILKLIRYELITPEEFTSSLVVKQNQELVGNIQKSLRSYYENPYAQPLLQSEDSSPRIHAERFCQIDGVQCQTSIKIKDSKLTVNAMSQKGIMQEHTNYIDPAHCVVELNGFIYCLGNIREFGKRASKLVQRFDPRTNSWLDIAPMISERSEFYACSLNNSIYVFGGKNCSGAIRKCERYCPHSNKWTEIASLPIPLFNFAGFCCVKNNCIFLSGGFTRLRGNDVRFNHFYGYKPDSDSFLNLPNLISDRGGHIMFQLQSGKLAVLGGQDHPLSGRNNWTVETFDLQTNQWLQFDQNKPMGPLAKEFRLNFRQENDRILIWAIDFQNSGKEIIEYKFSNKKWASVGFEGHEVIDIAFGKP